MKAVELTDAAAPLSTYAKAARRGPVILTRRGRAVAAVVAIDDQDWEDLRVSTSPAFAAIIARSEARYRREGGISLDELRRRAIPRRLKSTRRPK
jgi:prevent-host-death family protein